MTDEISATKAELANDLISVIRMNKELTDRVAEMQFRIDGLTHSALLLTEAVSYQKGRARELRSQLNSAKNEIKGLRGIS